MPKMNLSHFEAAFLFSVFTSVVLGVVTKRTDRDRLHYGFYTFGCFLLALFGLGWLMTSATGKTVLSLSPVGDRNRGVAATPGHHHMQRALFSVRRRRRSARRDR